MDNYRKKILVLMMAYAEKMDSLQASIDKLDASENYEGENYDAISSLCQDLTLVERMFSDLKAIL